MPTADLARYEISDAIARRAKVIPSAKRKAIFWEGRLQHEVWVSETYAGILLDNHAGIHAARQREKRYGQAFPSLVTTDPRAGALISITGYDTQLIETSFARLGSDHCIRLYPDATTRLFRVTVSDSPLMKGPSYLITNLYLLGFGSIISSTNFADHFDDLLAKHISTSVATR
jgi:hypothetical protein